MEHIKTSTYLKASVLALIVGMAWGRMQYTINQKGASHEQESKITVTIDNVSSSGHVVAITEGEHQ